MNSEWKFDFQVGIELRPLNQVLGLWFCISTNVNEESSYARYTFFFFYSSQEVIVLVNQKTASAIIKGTCEHTSFYPKCNIYHRFFSFFLCPLTYVKPLKMTTCLNGLKQWIFKPPSVSTSMNGHNIISRIQRCSIQN